MPLEWLKFKQIEICLEKKIKSEKECIKDLFTIISDLKKENNTLKVNQENLEKRIKELENDVAYFKEYIKIKEIEKEEMIKEKMTKIDSLIINNNKKYYTSLKNWINKPNIQFELLYRLSRDGIEYKTFHDLCDNKGNTLLIVKLSDGHILGGFTTQNWDNSRRWKDDKNSFVFSLTKNLKSMKNNELNETIFCENYDRGPCFGFFLYFYRSKMNVVGIDSNDNHYLECNKLHSGNSKYGTNKVDEAEVFKIIN